MSARPTDDDRLASRYAAALLQSLDLAVPAPALAPLHPALAAAACGLQALTGESDGPALICPAPLAAAADAALAALATLAPEGAFEGLAGRDLLTERAAVFGHARRGAVSPGGSCRLLATGDGAVALNLARDDDWSLLPALFERDLDADWPAVTRAVSGLRMHDVVERGRELGLAVAPVVPPPSQPPPWVRTVASARPDPRPAPRPRVLDLSSLWAGPLCGHLLQRCGAEVVKLEGLQRPDGARRGPAAFFDLMNAGKRCVALDFGSPGGRRQLAALIARADIVIEASRPRALRQLGIDAEALVRERPGLTWISLTGYGREAPAAQWVAYGDDAGVAGGLAYLMRQVHGHACFVGDAIADPLAGLHAALAAWAGWRAGGGGLLSVSLVDVIRHVVGFEAPTNADGWHRRARDWAAVLTSVNVRPPQARSASARAAAPGDDNAHVFADWGLAC
ncbi:CoA transferase [Sinimarinibacterium flocculans]|uniref:CoA transferase family III n=1 Tax=Sinimarinibacterium flocculans TaxID=985250 RepID=A0A318EI17_9GAMM|nr:CoA transferase [Sinimarinibacterium flocculans]PXV70495.1 CoA transferase family III [Sinimarinibacterium flocculans]